LNEKRDLGNSFMTQSSHWHRRALLLATAFLLPMVFYYGCKSSETLTEASDSVFEEESVNVSNIQQTKPVGLEGGPEPMTEFRGVWVATVANIDWPSEPGLTVQKQKEELVTLLDKAASLHFNAVIFQVRPAADAMYQSHLEPWSYYLTGKMGRAPIPEFDPLEFVIQEAHKRGMELHAWFNPYRAGHPTDKSDEISPDHISKTDPDYVVEYGDFLWLDPGSEGAREHTLSVIMDVVERYDVDGVHFDDYFYPYPSYADGADFPDDRSWQIAQENGNTLSRGDWRRENVNKLMKELSDRIKNTKPHVKFGISPFGIWRPGFPENTTGFDAYENLYADARLWIKEGWVDYFTPQIYYKMDQVPQPFPIMLEWWLEQNEYDRHIWPGLYTSRLRTQDRTWPSEEIMGQIYTSRGFPGVSGAIHFSMKTFLENTNGFNQQIAAGPHALPSVVPASPWMKAEVPLPPGAEVRDYGDFYSLHIEHKAPETVRWWIVRSKIGEVTEYDVIPAYRRDIRYYGGKSMKRPDEIRITAVNRLGVQSRETSVFPEQMNEKTMNVGGIDRPEMILRDEWGEKTPGGVVANGIRRNILQKDTLRFHDLTIVFEGMVKSVPFPARLLKAPETAPENQPEEKETIVLQLFKNGVSERMKIEQGDAFNWYGYHIGVIQSDFQSGMVQIELATVSSLSVSRAVLTSVGSANDRIRVPHNITHITLHHTGSAEPLTEDADPVELLRNLYQWGAEDRNWWDVPYHYLIDLDGTIYEGRDERYAGDANTTYDPRGHLLISVMGNYTLQKPTDAQLEAISDLMAYGLHKHGLSMDAIGTHSHHADTSCPGTQLQRLFDDGTLLEMVQNKSADR
jgi:uncharacterized lipoprotein YddW (UPF0748 family)